MIARDTAFLLPLGVTLAFGGDLRVVAGWSLLGFPWVDPGPAHTSARVGYDEGCAERRLRERAKS